MKPGAGADHKGGGEPVDVVEGTMPQSILAAPESSSKKNSLLRWRSSNGSKGKAKEEVKEKEKDTPMVEERQSDRGRFVEDVSSSGLGSKGGTLKKKRLSEFNGK